MTSEGATATATLLPLPTLQAPAPLEAVALAESVSAKEAVTPRDSHQGEGSLPRLRRRVAGSVQASQALAATGSGSRMGPGNATARLKAPRAAGVLR